MNKGALISEKTYYVFVYLLFSGSMAVAFVVISVVVMFLKAAFPDSVFDVWSASAVLS